MSFIRSKTISHYQLVLHRENAYQIVGHLGRMGIVQIKGYQNLPIQMPYHPQVKLCQELLEKIKNIERELYSQGHGLSKTRYSREEYEVFLELVDRRRRISKHSDLQLLEDMAEDLQTIWNNSEQLKQRKHFLEEEAQLLKEEAHILQGGKMLFGSKLYESDSAEDRRMKQIGFKCGVMYKKDELRIQRLIFRISKGLSVFHSLDEDYFENQKESKEQKKIIFYLFFGFGTSEIVQSKINRTLEIYCFKLVDYPKCQPELEARLLHLRQSLAENARLQELVAGQTKNIYVHLLEVESSQEKTKFSRIEYNKLFFLYEKSIYEKINQMKYQHSFSQAEVFIQQEGITKLISQLEQFLFKDRMPMPQFIPISGCSKPTLFELNTITKTPYEILSAYGVPQYKQINPAIFNLITFPFLFGVMFSDIAHGLILLGVGLLMIYAPLKAQKHRILKALFVHRFTIALMGFFATYCGFIYNQFLSMDINLFGSCYQIINNEAIYDPGCVYPFGVDPIWSISLNQLQFTNSLKMKIAVIIAVVHMSFGIVLKGINQFYRQKKRYIIFQTLPQLTFFVLLFGYMDFLIAYKWLQQWTPADAPSIITTMINIPLRLGKTEECCNGGQPMWGQNYQHTSQNQVQLIILVVSVLCLPLILCLKPLQIYYHHKRTIKNEAIEEELEDELKVSKIWQSQHINQNLLQSELDHGHIDMSQVIVHQIIETIEFALGCISNTASYLRLWALSLAHQQLSEVFFEETVLRGLNPGGFIGIPISIAMFPVFAGITFGILLCMDSLQCFLHTLRLHWVEFQNKFYKGSGIQFVRFDLMRISNEWIEQNHIDE